MLIIFEQLFICFLPSVNPFQYYVYPCLLYIKVIILLNIKVNNIYFIYLAVMGLLCGLGMRDLSCSIQDPVPWPGIEPSFPALGARSSSHWTTGLPMPFFWLDCFLKWVLRVLYIFQKQVLCQIHGLQLYSQPIVFLFILFTRSFTKQKFLILMRFSE